jgi:uncharacterized protein
MQYPVRFKTGSFIILIILLLHFSLVEEALALTSQQVLLLKGARSTVGDAYDAGYYSGGPPPRGRGACTDVLYYALKATGIDLQKEVDKEISQNPSAFDWRRDRNIDYRWCPNLIAWFRRHAVSLPVKANFKVNKSWQAGDIIFWSLTRDGVADHCGIISDRKGLSGKPLVIHNYPPRSEENDALTRWMIVGHFRMKN